MQMQSIPFKVTTIIVPGAAVQTILDPLQCGQLVEVGSGKCLADKLKINKV